MYVKTAYCRLLRGGVDWNKREWWRCRLSFDKSPPSRRRGLKFYFLPVDCAVVYRRLLRGGVDWNFFCRRCCGGTLCRLLRGGVDWNLHCRLCSHPPRVASFAEAWIEMRANCWEVWLTRVASFAEAWIEIAKRLEIYIDITSPPSRRRGLKSWFLSWSFSPVLVASFAEAWIEIGNPHYSSRCCYIVSSQR